MANIKEVNQWEDNIYLISLSDPVIGGDDGISNKQAKQLANRTLWLKNETAKKIDNSKKSSAVNSTSTDTVATSSAVKRAYDLANAAIPNSKKSSAVNSTSTDTVATSSAVKQAYDLANAAIPNSKKSSAVNSTSTDTVATSSAVKQAYDLANAAIPNSKKSSAVNSTSTDTVATSSAVKQAYDKGVEALNKANSTGTNAVSKTGDTMTGVLNINNRLNVNNEIMTEYRLRLVRDKEEFEPYADFVRKTDVAKNTENKSIGRINFKLFNDGNELLKSSLQSKVLADNSSSIGLITTNSKHSANNAIWAFGESGNVVIGSATDSGNAKLQVNGGRGIEINTPTTWRKISATVNNGGVWGWDCNPESETDTRFNFSYTKADGSQKTVHFPTVNGINEKVAYQSWVQAQAKAVKTQKSRTITATSKGNSINVTGEVVTKYDGTIEQYFKFSDFSVTDFGKEQSKKGQAGQGYEIPVTLWTAMPNKITNVSAVLTSNDNVTLYDEASEWFVMWDYSKQGNIKDNIYLNLRRLKGDTNENVGLYIKVEGY